MPELCRHRFRPPAHVLVYLLVVPLLLFTVIPPALAETMRIPMSLELSLLRTLIVDQAYHEPGERAKVVVMSQGCNEIWLGSPQLSEASGLLLFSTSISVHWGTPLAGACLAPLIWEGSLVLQQRPLVNNSWQLRFQTLDSTLLDRHNQPAPLVGLLWNLIKDHVHAYLSRIAINLAPPVDNLKQFMLSQSTDESGLTTERVLAAMRPDRPVLSASEIRIDIIADAEPLRRAPEPDETMTLSVADRQRIIQLWQSWDAMLIHLISQLSDKPLTEEDRQLLLDAMLTVRYEFNDALLADRLTNAFVRDQFIQTWTILKPLFRRHLDTSSTNSILGYLSFFTAADALTALDQLGPLLGVEISRAGLYRLAFMLSEDPLDESDAVNPQLRRILGFDDLLTVPQPPVEPAEKSTPQPTPQLPLPDDSTLNAPLKPAHAVVSSVTAWLTPSLANAAPSIDEVRSWTAGLTPADRLLPRVRQVIEQASLPQRSRLAVKGIDNDWFLRMMYATAWQESCFRQFVVKDNKITFLLSYNNTSVGLMQINEKVWRGIYNTQELRWNIAYNTTAGAEILALYLQRYINQEPAAATLTEEAGRRYLASWLYALYNGGPGQLKKFPSRHAGDTLYRSDELFREKYDRVAGDSWLTAVDCLPVR